MKSYIEATVLSRLTYASRAKPELANTDLETILAQAVDNNTKAGITGMLCFNINYFLQSIEGSRDQINQLYNKLMVDNRHFDVQVIEFTEIDSRTWPDWSMNYATPSDKNKSIYLKHSPTAGFNPFLLSADAALAMLKELSELE